ncbi:MAG: sensor histidine kinase [Alphaproteobacteria bacterium]|nr:sensor histidine kinase [Alphaproteobacteria bacterium]
MNTNTEFSLSLGTDSTVELNHRVANNLSLVVALVRLHASQLARERRAMSAGEVSVLLGDIASRIETAARLHRMLAHRPDSVTVDLAAYLRELCGSLAVSMPFGGTIECAPAPDDRYEIPPDLVLPVALIVTEAVTNAVKYAHPTGLPVAIEVACGRRRDGRGVIEVTDDGVGLPDGFDPAVDGSLGFQAMRHLARQAGADLAFESGPLGLRCTVTLPDLALN